LALLSEGPKYGLQLRQEFEAGTGEVWPLNVGQVYTTLQRLEGDELVFSGEADAGVVDLEGQRVDEAMIGVDGFVGEPAGQLDQPWVVEV